jgi:preprotein translocase subunit SecY
MKDAVKFYGLLVHFTAISYFYSHWVYFVVILVYFSMFGILYLEKSGNPDPQANTFFQIGRKNGFPKKWFSEKMVSMNRVTQITS